MSIVSNDPEGYRAVGPKTPFIIDASSLDHLVSEQAGLYYRDDLPQNFTELASEVLDNGPAAALTTYQYWVESGWKTEHGTYDSVERFSGKTREEYGELVEAIQTKQPISQIVSEAGDVLWCLTAMACNGGVDLDAEMRTLLFRYVRGTRYVDSGAFVAPPWREAAAQLATKDGKLTLGDIDNLMAAGFEPMPSPTMNVYEPDSLADHLHSLRYPLLSMQSWQERQYGYNDTELTLDVFKQHAVNLADMANRAILELAYIVTEATHGAASFSDVVTHNVQKISARIEQQLVDKTDGQRPEELQ